jgi:predicted RNA binding protein YcfA (HicA-like mRNA interferase family)
MDRIKPKGWQIQVRIFEKYGCVFQRQKSYHMVFNHPKAKRAVVIPKYKEVSVSIIKSNMKTVGMSIEEYLELAKNT